MLIGVFVIFTCLFSCSESPFKLFEYADKPFEATVSGVFGEQEIKSDIYCDFSDENSDDEEEKILVVAKLSKPDALEGATVTVYGSGRVSLHLGELEAPAGNYSGLGELYMLLYPEGEPYSVEKIEHEEGDCGILAIFSDGNRELSYFFKEGEDFPTYIRGVYGSRSVDISLKAAKYVSEK